MRRNLHSANLTREAASKERGAGAMDQKEILLYVSHPSWRSWRTRRLLRRWGYHFKVFDTTADAGLGDWVARFGGRATTPYVFVDHRPVGGLSDVRALAHSGEFDRLVRGEV
jgi:glutaredoxin